MTRESWAIFDERTGNRVGMLTYSTKERVEQVLDEYKDRDLTGGRPDLHYDLPHWVAGRIR